VYSERFGAKNGLSVIETATKEYQTTFILRVEDFCRFRGFWWELLDKKQEAQWNWRSGDKWTWWRL
jgi:hypothetical protein